MWMSVYYAAMKSRYQGGPPGALLDQCSGLSRPGFDLIHLPCEVMGYGNEARLIVQPTVEHLLEFVTSIGLDDDFIHT